MNGKRAKAVRRTAEALTEGRLLEGALGVPHPNDLERIVKRVEKRVKTEWRRFSQQRLQQLRPRTRMCSRAKLRQMRTLFLHDETSYDSPQNLSDSSTP